MYGPSITASTANRFYWMESTSILGFHYSQAQSLTENTHPIAIDSSTTNGVIDVAVSESRLVAAWGASGRLAVWGPDVGSVQIGTTMSLPYPSSVTLDGSVIYYMLNPTGGSPTPGIYAWDPPNGQPPGTLFASFAELQGDRTLALLLRATTTKLLMSDKTDVWFVDRTTKGSKQLLFDNPTDPIRLINDIRPARPRTSEGGVLINLRDPVLIDGRDYYVHLSAPNVVKDLSAAITTLVNASACRTVAGYNGGGVLFNQRYIYAGTGGLFAVDLSTSGDVSNLVRLADMPLRCPEVTGEGDLFAGLVYNVSRWDYFLVGRL
jgi:hypothetical protein